MTIRTRTIALALLLVPAVSHAQGEIRGSTLSAYLLSFIGFIDDVLVPLLFAVAFLVFIWGVFQYLILGGANEEKRDEGKKLIVWGIVAFFVMVSVWGLVNVLVGTFQFGNKNAPPLPTFNPSAPASGTGTYGPTP